MSKMFCRSVAVPFLASQEKSFQSDYISDVRNASSGVSREGGRECERGSSSVLVAFKP